MKKYIDTCRLDAYMRRTQGQTSAEFIIITSLVLLVLLAIFNVSIYSANVTTSARISEERAYFSQLPVGILSIEQTSIGLAVGVTNTIREPVEVSQIVIDSTNILSSPIILNTSQIKIINSTVVRGADTFSYPVKIVYKRISSGETITIAPDIHYTGLSVS
ncbi:MAG: hypothetical protein ACI8Y7_000117 [Candidatus Woesearchaeota archaeon]|jgi:hypothetical protein